MKLISLIVFRKYSWFMEFFKRTIKYVSQNKHYKLLYKKYAVKFSLCYAIDARIHILLTPFLLRVIYVNHGTRFFILFYSLKTPRLIPALKWIESINFLEENATTISRPLITSNTNSDPDKAKKLSALKGDSVRFSTIIERLKA